MIGSIKKFIDRRDERTNSFGKNPKNGGSPPNLRSLEIDRSFIEFGEGLIGSIEFADSIYIGVKDKIIDDRIII